MRLHNTSKNLATASGVLRKEGIEKSDRWRTIAINTVTYFAFRREQAHMVRRGYLTSMTNNAASIGTCAQSGGDASGKIPRPHGISKLDCELPNRSLLESEQPHARVAVDQGNRSSQIAG